MITDHYSIIAFLQYSYCAFCICIQIFDFLVYLHTVPPKIIMNGPRIAHTGKLINISCLTLEGWPLPDIYISTPLGVVFENQSILFIATLQYTGHYMCSATISTITVTESYYLLVYGKALYQLYVYQMWSSHGQTIYVSSLLYTITSTGMEVLLFQKQWIVKGLYLCVCTK